MYIRIEKKRNKMKKQTNNNLSNLQQELLKLFSFELPESELQEIKEILSQHFADKLRKETSDIWKEKGYSNKLMDEWLNENKQ